MLLATVTWSGWIFLPQKSNAQRRESLELKPGTHALQHSDIIKQRAWDSVVGTFSGLVTFC